MLGTQWTKSTFSADNGQCVEAKQVTTNWRKSTFSSGSGQCVEVAEFRKSTFSGAGGDCVEVADGADFVLVRDSKDPGGPVLTFTLPEWKAFVAGVKAGQFEPAPF
jgi:hypothetical protein